MIDFSQIKEKYSKIHNKFLENSPFLVKYNKRGIWAPSIPKEAYRILSKYKDSEKTFLDLGSGDGLVVMIASLFFKRSAGIEIEEEFFNISKEIEKSLNVHNVQITLGNFMDVDFSNYDIIFIAPDKPFSLELENKIAREFNGMLIVYSSIFQPKTLKLFEQFQTHHFDVYVYKNSPK